MPDTPLDVGDLIWSAFVASTVTVYVVKFDSPVMTHVNVVVTHDCPPGDANAVYEETVVPPLSADAAHDTVSCPLPGVVDTLPGADGAAPGVTDVDGVEEADVPKAFVMVTANV